ncbi:hypothetical protein ABID60_006840 [Bradyrhizobium sp. S3.5.5]
MHLAYCRRTRRRHSGKAGRFIEIGRRLVVNGRSVAELLDALPDFLSTAGEPDRATSLAQFFKDVPSGTFYGFNRSGAKVSQGLIDNWWRQGMMGGAKAHYDCIKAFSDLRPTSPTI